MKAPIAMLNKALLLSLSLSPLSDVHLKSGHKRGEKCIQPTKEGFTIQFPFSKCIEDLDVISPANDLPITMLIHIEPKKKKKTGSKMM